jgi:hypothetical protein
MSLIDMGVMLFMCGSPWLKMYLKQQEGTSLSGLGTVQGAVGAKENPGVNHTGVTKFGMDNK